MTSSRSWLPASALELVYQHPRQTQHLEQNWASPSLKGTGRKDSWEFMAACRRLRIKGDIRPRLGGTEAAGACAWKAQEGRRGGEEGPRRPGRAGGRSKDQSLYPDFLGTDHSPPCSGRRLGVQEKMKLLQSHLAEPELLPTWRPQDRTGTRGPTSLMSKDAKIQKRFQASQTWHCI